MPLRYSSGFAKQMRCIRHQSQFLRRCSDSHGSGISQAGVVLERFLEEMQARIISISPAIGRSAIAAFDRFGKGRHRAGLNMGDCFAYACARELDVPILAKGNDFPQTDITIA